MKHRHFTQISDAVRELKGVNEVRADGGCLYCEADQGETHRPGCARRKHERREEKRDWIYWHQDDEGGGP